MLQAETTVGVPNRSATVNPMQGSEQINDNTRGILFMILAMATMLTSDRMVKSVAQELPLFQIMFIRHIFMTVGLEVTAFRDGGFRFRPTGRKTRLISLRTIGEVGIVYFYMTALTMMSLGTGTALFQLQPLAVALAAAIFLAQPIGPRLLLAIIIGFGGVLLIVRPGTEAFTLAAHQSLEPHILLSQHSRKSASVRIQIEENRSLLCFRSSIQ